MPRPSKIVQLGLEEKVLKLANKGKSNNDIAITLQKENNVKISAMAVNRYLNSVENAVNEKAVDVIKEDKRRVVKSINQSYDVIQSQLEVSARVLEKLEGIQDVDDLINKITESGKVLLEHGMKITGSDFGAQIAKQISDNIKDFTALTKEVRENNKFLAELQTRIYDFSLLEEFIRLFINEFETEDKQITKKVLERISSNPRMKWLAEEQNRIRGE